MSEISRDGKYVPGIVDSTGTQWPKRPPNKRLHIERKIQVGAVDVFLGVGEVEGKPCEIFIDLNKEGSTIRGLLNCLAIVISLGLQYGVPLETFVSYLKYSKFEPNGLVIGYSGIKKASSIIDMIFRLLGKEYLNSDAYPDDYSGADETDL